MTEKNRKLRAITSALLVVWLAILMGVVLYRQWQRRGLITEVEIRPEQAPPSEQPVRVQKGFVFTYALGVSPSFRVAARESVEFSSGWLELRDVSVTFFREGQVAYGLAAQSARLNHVKNEAVLQGEPQINFGHGVVVRAQAFNLTGSERRLTSLGSVSFAGPGWGALAGSLMSSLAADEVSLGDGISIVVSEIVGEPVTLLASSAVYHHREGFVQFPEGVTVLRGKLSLQAPLGSLWFDGAGGGLQKLRLEGRVILSGTTEEGEVVDGEFSQCVAERLDGSRVSFSAGPAPNSGWVTLRVSKPGEGTRELRCWRLVGLANMKGLQSIEARDQACATAVVPGEGPWHLATTSLFLSFSQGQAAQVHAFGNVELEGEGAKIIGDEMSATVPKGPGQVWAATQGQVVFVTDTVKGACQRLTFEPNGAFTATGGVQGTVQPKNGQGRDNAARFAAERAFGDFRSKDVVTLEGQARVWQEGQIVTATTITIDRPQSVLSARGQVLTQASRQDGSLSIEAEDLFYDQQKNVAEYRGGVTVQDGQRILQCQTLTAFLSERGELLRADLNEGVNITDQQQGRKMSGNTASYVSSADMIVIRGKPAMVEEATGNKVQAATIVWYRRTGNLEVGGELESPSQIVYHPTQLATPPAGRTPSPRKR